MGNYSGLLFGRCGNLGKITGVKMIDWQKLLKKARIALGNTSDGSPEEKRLEKIVKYCKFRIDSTIYQRKETVIFWDSSEKVEQETKTSTETTQAQNFGQYCDEKYKNTLIEKKYLFK
jgi:hypothetical protein